MLRNVLDVVGKELPGFFNLRTTIFELVPISTAWMPMAVWILFSMSRMFAWVKVAIAASVNQQLSLNGVCLRY